MIIKINWNTLSIDEWEEKFSCIPRSNILQSYTYAKAYAPIAKQKPRWGLILIDGREAGLVQMFEAGILWNLFHAVTLDRGPLWFEGFGNAMHVKKFFDEWNEQFRPRFGRKRRILPEIEDGPTAAKMLSQTGMTLQNEHGYQTIWLDLTLPLDTLRANLKSNWRNHLNKSEKSGLPVTWELRPETIPLVLAIYATDKAARGYGGPTAEFLASYAPLLAAKGDLHLARVMHGPEIAAFVMIATHGRSATYLAGWSSQWGRENAAHQLLLWDAIKMLQNKGIKDFDLGGINDEQSLEGIRTFKEGMGGRITRYAGLYS